MAKYAQSPRRRTDSNQASWSASDTVRPRSISRISSGSLAHSRDFARCGRSSATSMTRLPVIISGRRFRLVDLHLDAEILSHDLFQVVSRLLEHLQPPVLPVANSREPS